MLIYRDVEAVGAEVGVVVTWRKGGPTLSKDRVVTWRFVSERVGFAVTWRLKTS